MNRYVYKITNMQNGMYYIGKRSTRLPIEDPYMGSGILIKKVLEELGRKVFHKEIIAVFETQHEALEYESSLVNEIVVNDQMSYNILLGGSREFDRTSMITTDETKMKVSLENKGRCRRPMKPESIARRAESQRGLRRSEETREKMREAAKNRKRISEEDREKISARMTGKSRPDLQGKKRTEEQCQRMSAAHAGKTLDKTHCDAIHESRRRMSPEERAEKFGHRKSLPQTEEEKLKRSKAIRDWWKRRKNAKEDDSITE